MPVRRVFEIIVEFCRPVVFERVGSDDHPIRLQCPDVLGILLYDEPAVTPVAISRRIEMVHTLQRLPVVVEEPDVDTRDVKDGSSGFGDPLDRSLEVTGRNGVVRRQFEKCVALSVPPFSATLVVELRSVLFDCGRDLVRENRVLARAGLLLR